MMTEGNRLCSLKVGITRHYGFAVLFSLVGDNLDEVNNEILNIDNLFFKVKLDVKRNLVVTAAGCMKSFAVVADSLCQLALDKGVNVLCLHIELQCAAFDVGKDSLQSLNDVG